MTRNMNELLYVEDPAVAVLTTHLGWKECSAQDADTLRPSRREPILIVLLEQKIRDLNPWISEENVAHVVRNITNVHATTLLEANEQIHAMLERGTTVTQDLGDGWGQKGRDVQLIDYETISNNEFTLIRQYPILNYSECIPDIVLFVNGLPLGVIECKSPLLEKPLNEGITQMNRYQENGSQFKNKGCPRLFRTAQVLVTASGDNAKVGTNYTIWDHWTPWKDPYPLEPNDLQSKYNVTPNFQNMMLFGVFKKENFLDIIRNFIVFERESGKVVKKIAKYQQFRATNKIMKRCAGETPESGFIWHWQGSGKSHTMLYTAVKLRREKDLNNPTIVVISDRTDLDQQIHGVFRHCGFPNPVKARTIRDLKDILSKGTGRMLMTTIQKFQDAAEKYPVLTEEKNVFVLVDEAHRSQYKTLAANMRRALPNACFIGFTGTPITKKDRDTFTTFGGLVDKYDHDQSVRDGITVPIYYEGRMAELAVGTQTVNDLFNRVFRDYSEDDRNRILKKYVTKEAIAIAPSRIETICLDLLHHYEEQILPNGFKAQIVAPNRRGAIRYKETIDRLGGPSCEVLISKMHNDEAEFTPYHRSKTEEEEIIRRFKDEEEPMIIIVCDKLLTGFNAPREQVMYLDAPLKEHNLLQAMGRVNRKYPKKDYGLVIDYWGVSEELRTALAMYSEDGIEGLIHTDFSTIVLPYLEAACRATTNIFSPVPRSSNAEEYKEACIQYLEPEDMRLRFDRAFRSFSKYMDMLLPNPRALDFQGQLEYLAAIRIAARNRYSEDRDPLTDCGAKVRDLIDNHIRAEGIVQLIEPRSIFSPEFEDEVSRQPSEDAMASMIEHAVSREINVNMNDDPVFYQSLSDRLATIINDYHQERISGAERLGQLNEVLEDARHPEQRAKDIGVEPEVAPFYELITADIDEETDYREIATNIVGILKSHVVIDWSQKEDVKRQMRRKIKRELRSVEYPQEKLEDIASRLVELAERRYPR